jgi:L-2-hydroxyglutarate oxidase
VGLASALAIARGSRTTVALLEAEERVAAHQTGNNSGVIHSGLYYAPGSRKAHTCATGRELLERYCGSAGIPFERCGKVVAARSREQIAALEELERRGAANGLTGIRRLSAADIREAEPGARGVAGLWVPQTGIVDYRLVARRYAHDLLEHGGRVHLGARVRGTRSSGGEVVLLTTRGDLRCRAVVTCAGLQSDRVARMCGVDPGVRIVPFRGEYYELAPSAAHLVRNLIYPVPDSRFPFLGVHFTRRITGEVEAGPNAVLALKREGYRRTSFSLTDAASTFTYPGFWRLARRYWKTGTGEMYRSWNKGAFVRALQLLVPGVERSDLRPGGTGVRAQALDGAGRLVDDFHIVGGERQIHVLNAPSPAATASLAIGRTVAAMAIDAFDLPARSGG